MGQSFCLLAAGLLAAQSSQVRIVEPLNAAVNARNGCACSEHAPSGRGGLFQTHQDRFVYDRFVYADGRRPNLWERIKTVFRRDADAGMIVHHSPTAYGSTRIVSHGSFSSAEPPLGNSARPLAAAATAVAVSTGASTGGSTGVSTANFRSVQAQQNFIRPRFVNKTGHEFNYSWITGQLNHDGQNWLIRYATPDVRDRFGGTVIVDTRVNMANFRDGDLVSVRGSVASTAGANAVYRAVSVDLIERD